jgi:hypothetical protein
MMLKDMIKNNSSQIAFSTVGRKVEILANFFLALMRYFVLFWPELIILCVFERNF